MHPEWIFAVFAIAKGHANRLYAAIAFRLDLPGEHFRLSIVFSAGGAVDRKSDREELERKLAQTTWLATAVTDQTALQGLRESVEELRQTLQRLISNKRVKSDKGEDEI